MSVYLDSPLGATLLNVYTVCNLIEKFVADVNMLWYIIYTYIVWKAIISYQLRSYGRIAVDVSSSVSIYFIDR